MDLPGGVGAGRGGSWKGSMSQCFVSDGNDCQRTFEDSEAGEEELPDDGSDVALRRDALRSGDDEVSESESKSKRGRLSLLT